MDWLSALASLAADAGGWVIAFMTIVIGFRLIANGTLVPGATHKEMREGYQKRIDELIASYEAQIASVEKERNWYRTRLLDAIEIGESLVEGGDRSDVGG